MKSIKDKLVTCHLLKESPLFIYYLNISEMDKILECYLKRYIMKYDFNLESMIRYMPCFHRDFDFFRFDVIRNSK